MALLPLPAGARRREPTGPDGSPVHASVADRADPRRLVPDEFTSRPEVSRAEPRLVFRHEDRGPRGHRHRPIRQVRRTPGM